MNFLERIFLSNTVYDLLVVLGIIVMVVLLRRLLSHYLASGIYFVVQFFWTTLDRRQFVTLVLKPMSWLLSITVALIALDKLHFPQAWDFNIHKLPVRIFLDKLGIGIWIISFIKLLLSVVNFIALILQKKALLTSDKADDQLVSFFREFIKVLIWIMGILLLLKAVFNQNIGYLLTSLSIVGAALALSAKESLENLIASFIIFFDKPFFVGDTVKVNAITGSVERIGLRSTRIRTADKTLVTVPNKQMVDSVVDNWSFRSGRRAELRLELSDNNSPESLNQFIQSIKDYFASKQPKPIETSTVFISDYSKNGPLLYIEYFTAHITLAEFNEIKHQVNLAIMQLVNTLHISLASNSSQLTIVSNDSEQAEAGRTKNIL